MAEWAKLFNTEFLGIALWVYLAAFGAILVGFVGKKIVNIVFKRLAQAAENTKLALDDVLFTALSKPVEWAVVIAGVFVALLILPLPQEPVNVEKFVRSLLTGASVALVVGLPSVWWMAWRIFGRRKPKKQRPSSMINSFLF